MRRGWKIAIGVVVGLAVALVVNLLVVDGETERAEVTVAGGRILDLPKGEMQVLEHGPRHGSPIVLIHCYTCGIDWWDGMMPLLDRDHRVIAVDLLGHDGSEKPASGYSIPNQADFVAEALRRLGVRDAEVVGHSLGGTVATALTERHPGLVGRLVIIDQAPDNSYSKGFPVTGELLFWPVLGQALWQIAPDFAVKDGLGVAFAPGFDVPDRFVEDFDRMTYTAYNESPRQERDYSEELPLNRRIARAGVPLLAIFGAEDQIYDSDAALATYAKVPGARTASIPGAGHSPNVEKPVETAKLVLEFAEPAPLPKSSRPPKIAATKQPAGDQGHSASLAATLRNRASGVRSATGDQ